MKKLFLILSVWLLLSLFHVGIGYGQEAENPACLEHQGTIEADTNWPAGSTLTLQCSGTPGVCHGDEQKNHLAYGTYDLRNCNCQAEGDLGKCVQAYNLPAGCTVEGQGDTHPAGFQGSFFCSTNGLPTYGVLKLHCSAPPVATSGPADTATPIPADTATPVPASTATPAPACGQTCTSNNYCQSLPGIGSCTSCLPTNGDTSNMTCQTPATATPTTSPGTTPGTPPPGTTPGTPPPGTTPGVTPPYACTPNVTTCNANSCSANGGASCSICNGGMCFEGTCTSCAPVPTVQPTATSVPPTPTPTPAFNCKCGGISTTAIIPGSQATVTGQALVEGADRANAQISTLGFQFAGGTNTSGQILQSTTSPASKVGSNATSDIYEAKWNLTIPQSITDGKIYKIFIPSNSIACGPKTTAYAQPQQVVLAANTSAIPVATTPNIFQRISLFFSGVFNNPNHRSVSQIFTSTFIQPLLTNNTGSQQIDTFKFAHVTIQTDSNSCKFLQVQYK